MSGFKIERVRKTYKANPDTVKQSSRLFVENIPKFVDERELRSHFSIKGNITDLKILKNKDGTSRRCCFLGFRTEEEAKETLQYFDKTFIHTCRIKIEYVTEMERDTKKAKVEQKTDKKKRLIEIFGNEQNRDFKRFLDKMLLKDDSLVLKSTGTEEKNTKVARGEDSDDDYQDISSNNIIKDTDPVIPEIEEVQKKNVDNISIEKKVRCRGKLVAKNLSYSCTYEDLVECFKNYNPDEIILPIKDNTQENKGFAYIGFKDKDNRKKASELYEYWNGRIFQGRIMKIEFSTKEGEEYMDLSYKQQKNKEIKEKSGSSFNWNTFFINRESVVEYISKKFGVKKSEILDPKAGDMAAKIAIAESQIIQETKEYFKRVGLNVDLLERISLGGQRSRNIIIIKNISFDTEECELTSMFSKFGNIERCIFPPTRSIMVLVFSNSAQAYDAFRNLAYRKFKHIPLYLEWAPEGLFNLSIDEEDPSPQKEDKKIEETISDLFKTYAVENKRTLFEKEHECSDPSNVLYVKNINFTTTKDDLEKAVRELGLNPTSVRITRKKCVGGYKSAGYGFIGFETVDDATKSLVLLKTLVLNNHLLSFQYSSPSTVTFGNESDSPTLVIKNIPFEAKPSDLKKIFKPFGQIQRLFLPKKPDNTHRGFGFIEFSTHKEAAFAKDSLRHTHLYGRHLVIDFAASDTDDSKHVSDLRRKATRQIESIRAIEMENRKFVRTDES